ncbi:signal transduction histidine kinase [Sphingomonas naasensis]|nr:histidine kinase [Sphingomonas naasensis]NIJ19168.1 signal transduction histidine kinase [Sphingomonas naasensis]
MKPNTDIRQAATLIAATWILTAIFLTIPFHLFRGGAGLNLLISLLHLLTVGSLLSFGVYLAVRAARRRSRYVRFAATSVAVVLAAAALSMSEALISEILDAYFPEGARPAPFAFRATNAFAALIWEFALLGTAFSLLDANNLARERERELALARENATRAEAAASAARLAALRYQLNPHFLFNTLNAISSLIVTRDYGPADAMLGKLSEFLRATLAANPDALILLEDELATLQHYLEIESARFGERLEVAFVCPSDLNDALVPSFVLQPLVENAIKYAVAPSADPVAVRVEATRDGDDLVIFVEDDGASGDAPARSGTGVGIPNIRQRLHTLYGSRGTIETTKREQGFVSILRFPLTRRAAHRPEQAA